MALRRARRARGARTFDGRSRPRGCVGRGGVRVGSGRRRGGAVSETPEREHPAAREVDAQRRAVGAEGKAPTGTLDLGTRLVVARRRRAFRTLGVASGPRRIELVDDRRTEKRRRLPVRGPGDVRALRGLVRRRARSTREQQPERDRERMERARHTRETQRRARPFQGPGVSSPRRAAASRTARSGRAGRGRPARLRESSRRRSRRSRPGPRALRHREASRARGALRS